MYLPRMCLLFFYFDDSSLFFIAQETSEKLKLSHSAQPENKPVKVTPLPFSLFLFQFLVLLPFVMKLLMPNLLCTF
jgi:hypothetical protein